MNNSESQAATHVADFSLPGCITAYLLLIECNSHLGTVHLHKTQ
jgi:hypothetical protein